MQKMQVQISTEEMFLHCYPYLAQCQCIAFPSSRPGCAHWLHPRKIKPKHQAFWIKISRLQNLHLQVRSCPCNPYYYLRSSPIPRMLLIVVLGCIELYWVPSISGLFHTANYFSFIKMKYWDNYAINSAHGKIWNGSNSVKWVCSDPYMVLTCSI